jgi:2-polyprenyl-3-methyl-5-hydroxy-6-metoxy-1,4-benzoquinol methylase
MGKQPLKRTSAVHDPSLADQHRYWDARWDRTRSPNDWSLRRGEAILELIRPLPLERPTILDVGCGTGWFTGRLSRLGPTVGMDLSHTAIVLAKSQFPDVTFIAGNVFETQLPTAHFDLVVSQEVIAHVKDQSALLDCIAEAMKPGGYLVITTANKLVMNRVDFGPDPDAHIKQWLDIRTLKRLLRRRFDVLRTTSVLPMGDRGFLRIVNSAKINDIVSWVIPRRYLEAFKERAGLGYTLVALAQKKS